ncbi:hypothetical protein ACP70R_012112 [Stipagrostis hirtigluma subsp. patula]
MVPWVTSSIISETQCTDSKYQDDNSKKNPAFQFGTFSSVNKHCKNGENSLAASPWHKNKHMAKPRTALFREREDDVTIKASQISASDFRISCKGLHMPVYGPATVEAASLSRGPVLVAGANATAAAYLYDLSLTVAVRNPNVALRARHAAPLDAELRVAGRRFGGAVRLADAGKVLRPKETQEYHVQAGSVRADGMKPGSALEVEVTLARELRYESIHRARKALVAVCQTMLPLPPPPPPGTMQVAPRVPVNVPACIS